MKTINCCRVCGGSLEDIMSLGEQCVSDFPEPNYNEEVRAPLELVLCSKCSLVQLRHTVPAELMYKNYWYRSGTNQTMKAALADIVQKAERLMRLSAGDAVLDIGCNDGTLLSSYSSEGIFKMGFDPAENMAVFSRMVANEVVVSLFEASRYYAEDKLKGVRPKIVTSIAMFYDLDDPRQFVSDIKAVMHQDGLWILQMSYLPLMLKENEIGNICHEHLEYYSLQSLEYLLNDMGMEVVDVELNNVNGGSIRAYIRRRGARIDNWGNPEYYGEAAIRVETMRRDERALGLDSIKIYKEFATWAERIKNDVVGFIKKEVANGKKVYVYGASTKGNTVLQYYGLDNKLITAAAERNVDKWGRVTVGTKIPIVSEKEARDAKPDFFLVLPWHFVDEFVIREKGYLASGGRFILPMPHFTLI